MSSIDPAPSFGSYPISGFPEQLDLLDPVKFTGYFSDTHARIRYLKDAADSAIQKLANAEAKTGLNLATTSLPAWATGGSQDLSSKTVQEAVEALNAYLAALDTIFANMQNNIGGNVETSTPNAYSSTNKLSAGDSHHTGLEKLDSAIDVNEVSINNISPIVASNTEAANNIADKIATYATSPGTGLSYGNNALVPDDTQVDDAITILSKATLAERRIHERNYILAVKNWRDTAFGEDGGATPNSYFYDSLYSNSKINSANSTMNSYDNVTQSFGRDDNGWVYYSEIQSIPAGTNRIKIRRSGLGAVSFSCNFQGSFASGFVDLPAEDTWVSVPAGSQLVMKIVGSSGARLYSYQVLFKTV